MADDKRKEAYDAIKDNYVKVIEILKDEFYNEPIYNLSIYKKIFIDLNSCLVKTEVKPKTNEEIEELFKAKQKKLEKDYKKYYNTNNDPITINNTYIETNILNKPFSTKRPYSQIISEDEKKKYINELIAEETKKQKLANAKFLKYTETQIKKDNEFKYEGKEKINYKKLKTIYFVLFTLYKELYDKIIDFKKRYFEPSTNNLRKLDEEKEKSLINEQKTKADEIIEYNILFKFMNKFLLLSKFIYNFENYYNSFATERKSLKIIFKIYTFVVLLY
jgi:hypothetical protein